MTAKMLLVGCGKMGSALLQRAANEFAACVVDPASPPAFVKALSGVSWLAAPEKIDPAYRPDIIVIAIKPQHMAEIVPAYGRFDESVFLSIAAGQTLAKLRSFLGNKPIVRAMPNLPASIGQGISVAVAAKNVTARQKSLCEKLLRSVGDMAWAEDESWLDAVTALSGSGPAYVFALVEAMATIGHSLGLPSDLAEQLARKTVIGCGALLAESGASASALRLAVTSPGGTTEAALKQLLGPGGLSSLIEKTMSAAAERAKELAKS